MSKNKKILVVLILTFLCYYATDVFFTPVILGVNEFPLIKMWSRMLNSDIFDRIVDISATDDGVILARTSYMLYSLTENNGDLIWKFRLKQQTITRPAVALDGKVYVADGETLWALNQKTGEEIWKQPLTQSDGWIVDVNENEVLVDQPSYDISAYDIKTGHFLWSAGTGRGDVQAFLDDKVVYIPDEGVQAVDYLTGATIWSQGNFVTGQASYKDGIIYYRTDNSIFAFDARMRKELWQLKIDGNGFIATKIDGNYLFAVNSDYIYVIDPLNGSLLWRVALSQPLNPVIVDDKVFVMEGFSKIIRVFELKTGARVTSLLTSMPQLLLIENQDITATEKTLIFSKGRELFAYGK